MNYSSTVFDELIVKSKPMMVYIDNMKLKSYIVTFICFSIDETVF